MKLYKEFKENVEAQVKEQKDREKLQLAKETVVIYERTDFVDSVAKFIRNLFLLLLFAVIMLIFTAVVAGVIIWIGKGV